MPYTSPYILGPILAAVLAAGCGESTGGGQVPAEGEALGPLRVVYGDGVASMHSTLALQLDAYEAEQGPSVAALVEVQRGECAHGGGHASCVWGYTVLTESPPRIVLSAAHPLLYHELHHLNPIGPPSNPHSRHDVEPRRLAWWDAINARQAALLDNHH